MRILVVCQYYWPEPYLVTDVCEELARRGHQIQVVTDVPNYPIGRIYSGYRKGKNRNQVHNGVKIHRTFTIGRRNNVLFRLINYFSFAFSSLLYLLRMKEDFDVVFTIQASPVTMSGGALAYGRKHRKKVVLYCTDLWPASLAAGGVKEKSIVYRFFEQISKWIYTGADQILISSESFRGYLEHELRIPAEKISYRPQYADFVCEPAPPVEKDTVDLMFAGNIGTAQSIPTILKAAKILEDQKELRWHIVGEGSELDSCKRLAAELKLENVIFYGRRDVSEMPKLFAMADAMLLTLFADPLISLTLPRKTQTYLAAGKPIIGAADGEIPRLIEKSGCGFCARSEDANGLAEAVLKFMQTPNIAQLGSNARAYYEQFFSRKEFMDQLEDVLLSHEMVTG